MNQLDKLLEDRDKRIEELEKKVEFLMNQKHFQDYEFYNSQWKRVEIRKQTLKEMYEND